MPDLIDLQLLPGIVANSGERMPTNRWTDCDHVRFRSGLPEKLGGWTRFATTGEVRIKGYCRTSHDWSANNLTAWASFGTDEKLYVLSGTVLSDVTPTTTGTLTNPFSVTSGSKVVTVTHTSYGLTVGTWVRFTSASAVGGLDLTVQEYQITEVTDTNTYKFLAQSNATSTATGGGTVTWVYSYPAGPVDTNLPSGWGRTGVDSGGNSAGWGSPSNGLGWSSAGTYNPSTGDGQINRRFWSLDNWGEDLIASPRRGPVYVWVNQTGTTVRASKITAAPSVNSRVFVDENARILVCAGTVDANTGNFDALLIRWSDIENYNQFTPSSTNASGAYRLNTGSKIIAYVKSKRETLLFTDKHVVSMQYVGGTDIYSFTPVGHSIAVAGPQAVTEVNGVVYFMTASDFYIYDGTLRPVECDVRTKVFGQLDIQRADKITASVNQQYNEIWWLYPAIGSIENNRYVIYNFKDQTWYYGSLDRTVMHDYSLFFQRPYGVRSDGYIFVHESGYDDVDSSLAVVSLNSWLESYQMEVNAGTTQFRIDRLVPNFMILQGTAYAYLKGRHYSASSQLSLKGPYKFNSTTEKIDVRISKRQLGLRFEHNVLNSNWRMGSWRVRTIFDGKR